jgi:hypothetical protein
MGRGIEPDVDHPAAAAVALDVAGDMTVGDRIRRLPGEASFA